MISCLSQFSIGMGSDILVLYILYQIVKCRWPPREVKQVRNYNLTI